MATRKSSNSIRFKIDPFDFSSVAVASPQWRSRERVYAIDAAMRTNYDILRAKVADSLRPVLVVQFDLCGGTYNLITKDMQITVRPVPPVFQQIKSICHCPLGIYTVLAPHLEDPSGQEWVSPLRQFGLVVNEALDGLKHLDLHRDVLSRSATILKESLSFILSSVKRKNFSMQSFRDYSDSIFEAVSMNMITAAQVQTTAVVDLLLDCKKPLGPEWRNLYSAVLTTWTIEDKNQHWLVLRRMMDKGMLDERLYVINVGNARENTVDVALMNLAIIVQDKIAGRLVFGDRTPTQARLNIDLATRNDLLSSSVEKVIDEVFRERGCG